ANPVQEMLPRLDELALVEQRGSKLEMSANAQRQVVLSLREQKQLLAQLTSGVQLTSHVIEGRQPSEDREDLLCRPDELAQLSGARVGGLDLRGGIALGGDERRTHLDLEGQFLLMALGCLRQRLEQLEALGQMPYRFDVRGAGEGELRGHVVVATALFGEAR